MRIARIARPLADDAACPGIDLDAVLRGPCVAAAYCGRDC
jgi:hypothetical protein